MYDKTNMKIQKTIDDNKSLYKKGDTSRDGYKIEEIIIYNRNCIIFKSTNQIIGYEYQNIAFNPQNIEITCHELYTMLLYIDYPIFEIEKELKELFVVLFAALNADSEENGLKKFEVIEKRIRALRPKNQAKLDFLIILIACFIFFTSVFGILFYFIPTNDKNIFLCSIGGGIGSLLSVLHKNLSISFIIAQKKKYILTEALVKILLGMLFGGVLYIIIKSNLILGVVGDNKYALVFFSLLAGFSERFIPNLFKKLENNSGKS